MLAAPVNPSDLMLIRGGYSIRPELPTTPASKGWEWLKRRAEVCWAACWWGAGSPCRAPSRGHGPNTPWPPRTAFPRPGKTLRRRRVHLLHQPATALILSTVLLNIPPGGTLVQTAAASAVGLMVARLGRRLGFRTVNIVHRDGLAERLLREGVPQTDILVSYGLDLAPLLQERLKIGVEFAIDPVGGHTATALASALGPGGRLVLYGTLSSHSPL